MFFCLARYLLSWFFGKDSRLLGELSVSVPFGIPRLLASLASSLGHMRQKEKSGVQLVFIISCSKVPSWSASSVHLLVFTVCLIRPKVVSCT